MRRIQSGGGPKPEEARLGTKYSDITRNRSRKGTMYYVTDPDRMYLEPEEAVPDEVMYR